MSRSAGRVLIIPKGEYNASTQYSMLDLVEYNGCGYVAKQATKGNLPTNDTYWQQMGTTGGGGDPSAYMLIDGSNAEIINFAGAQSHTIDHINFTKSAGNNQTLSLQVHVKYSSTTGKLTSLIEQEIKAHIGDEDLYFEDDSTPANKIYFVIDSVGGGSISYDTDDDVINASAHLKVDNAEAMSFTDKSVSLGAFISSNVARGLTFGYGNALGNNLSFAGGRQSTAGGRSFAYGERCGAGDYAHAEGDETCAVLRSHAEGKYSAATGEGSHAEGTGTIAAWANQHAQGKWNLPKSTTLFEIGYGTPDNRSNVFEIYNDGSISFDNGTTKYKFAKVDGVNGYYDKGGTFHPMESTVLTKNNVQLSTTDPTNISIYSTAIKTTSRIQVFTNHFGIDPSDVEVGQNGNWLYLTFDAVESATTINIQVTVD